VISQHKNRLDLTFPLLALRLAFTCAILVGCGPATTVVTLPAPTLEVRPSQTPAPTLEVRPSPTPEPEVAETLVVKPSPYPLEVLDFRTFLPPVPSGLGEAANQLLFFSNRSGNYQLYQIALDGSGLVPLTHIPDMDIYDMEPAWSPDGRIAFTSNHVDGSWEIFMLYPDKPLPIQLTDWLADSWSLAWSPDGQSLAFVSNVTGDDEIYLISVEGGLPINLTQSPNAQDYLPVWSPDGQKIAFVSDRGQSQDIYVMASDGSGVIRLIDTGSRDSSPDWSPDGERIAFVSDSEGNFEIYVMEIAESNVPIRLTRTAGYEWSPTWSPDGKSIAFTSSRGQEENYDVYIMSPDGSNQTQLTSDPSNDIIPRWWP